MNNSNTIPEYNGNYNSCEHETIGFSGKRRPLTVVYLGNPDSPLRIFIIAGQHGDEKYGRKAVIRLITSLGNSFNSYFPSVRVAILLDANPDGSFRKSRTNESGIDLNRDHQRLDSDETLTIHHFVRAWRPHLIIDVHNYPSRRRHLLARNLVINHDLFIDFPTNPAISHSVDDTSKNEFLKTIQSDLKSLDFICGRYTIVKPSGRVRHSTPDVIDARNSLSLRYNTFTVLLEGRNPTREEGKAGREHIISAQYQALCAILKWVQEHQDLFTDSRKYVPTEKDKIAIRSKYRRADQPFRMSLKNSITKMTDVVAFPNYTPYLEITKYIELPSAYAVPLDKTKVIEILRRHGFLSQFPNHSKVERVEYYIIQSVKPSTRENRSPRKISILVKTEQKRLHNFIIFPINQEGGHSLAVFLEPESKYGLHRYNNMNLSIVPNSDYPILRVL